MEPAPVVTASAHPAFLTDPVVFRTWVDEVHRYVLARCGDRALAEDVTQEAFYAAVRHSGEHPDRPLTVGWLVTVARTRLIDHFRRVAAEERRMAKVGVDPDVSWPEEPVDSDRAARALGRLPAEQRAALLFHHVDELSVAELADQLGRSTTAVESLLARARRAFVRNYREVGDDN